jgi:hypothetical protein
MTMKTLAIVVVVAVPLGSAIAYYALRGSLDATAPPEEAERSATVMTPPAADRPATPVPELDIEGEPVSARQPELATDEQIRAATIPLERALAGLEEVKLRVPFPPNDGFRDTLRQFVAETDDPDWAPATEAHILGQISQATGLSAGGVEVDCRRTLCRILLTRPVSGANARYNGLNELVASFGLEPVMMMALADETGTPINFAYVRRGGP